MKQKNVRRVLRRTLRLAWGSVILAILLAAAVLPSLFTSRDPGLQNLESRLKPPGTVTDNGTRFLLGTDQLGRDLLARLVAGARVSLVIAISAVMLSTVFGVSLGVVGGFYGRSVREVVMRLTEAQLSLPYVLLALAIIGMLGPSIPRLVLVMVLSTWPTFARVVSAEVSVLSKAEFVEAARALGVHPGRIMFRHILPNALPSVIVLSTFTLATVVVAEAGLSFLGLGVPPGIPSWGSMLADGRTLLSVAWWLATLPGVAIFAAATSFNMLGDYLRDVLDPRLRGVM